MLGGEVRKIPNSIRRVLSSHLFDLELIDVDEVFSIQRTLGGVGRRPGGGGAGQRMHTGHPVAEGSEGVNPPAHCGGDGWVVEQYRHVVRYVDHSVEGLAQDLQVQAAVARLDVEQGDALADVLQDGHLLLV